MADDRLLSPDLEAELLAPDADGGTLHTMSVALATFSSAEVGLWEAGLGKDADTEVDEIFVVLAGAGTVTFADESTLRLRPGVAVRLYAGDKTRWNVTHRLRKLYLA
ncbi:cupin domain-containing protein [Streptomyces thinghirensis]|uniref:Cupin domain-containing protein n=1 Tax=Streptomyces thinghirensis TaxID=551547 RepID=A0ABP9T8J5_9ACTN